MRILIVLAFRNLKRHLRSSIIAILSVSVGLAIVLWLGCLMAGRNKNMIDKITSSYTGNLQISRQDYFNDRIINQSFRDIEGLEKMVPESTNITRRIHLPALISSGENSLPIILEGIEPENEARITDFKKNLVAGSYLESENNSNGDCKDRQVYISEAVAKLLNVEVGHKVVVLAQAADGSLGNDLLRVKGIFNSKSAEFDKKFAFSTLNCVQKIGVIGGFHDIIMGLTDPTQELKVKEELRNRIDSKYVITTWRETLPSVASLVKFSDAMLIMISSMLFVVVTFGIVNALLMNIFERTKEFGVMLALGTTPKKLWALIILECLMIGLFASVLGTGLGLAAVYYHQIYGFDLGPFLGERSYAGDFYLDMIIHPIFSFSSYVKSVLVTLCVVVISGLYPAYNASKLNPVDTMKA